MKAAQTKTDGSTLQNVVRRTLVSEMSLATQTTVECLTPPRGSPTMMVFGQKTVVQMIVGVGQLTENLTRECLTWSGRSVIQMTLDPLNSSGSCSQKDMKGCWTTVLEKRQRVHSRVGVVVTIGKEEWWRRTRTKGCLKLLGH